MDGRPTQLDTSNLIPIAGLAAVVIIVVGCYFAFKPAPPPKPPAQREAQESPAAQSESPGAQSKPAAVKPSTSGAKATKPTPASKTAASVNTSNPSNREAFHNYMRWIAWAYRDGLNLNEEVLTPKFRETVTLRGVDDPQMLDLHAKMLQNLKIYPLAPLVPTGTLDFGPGGVTKGHEDDPKTRREKLNLAVAMRRLVTTLKERYGVPVIDNPAEPEKTAAPAVPEDPAEAKTVIPPNAPDGEEEEK
ncbi:MAG: hypothetical protein M5U26_26280 [Planctomycetota bacterium]|nr:hypothetical protein [Planctomycetota bacterium]